MSLESRREVCEGTINPRVLSTKIGVNTAGSVERMSVQSPIIQGQDGRDPAVWEVAGELGGKLKEADVSRAGWPTL